MNSTGLKAWKGLKANSDTTTLKGESMPDLPQQEHVSCSDWLLERTKHWPVLR